MPPKKIDHPLVREWAQGLSISGRQQYLPAVRTFLRQRDPRSVRREDLVGYASAIASPSSRSKIIAALTNFFEALSEAGKISGAPARGLSRHVQEALDRRALAQELASAGVSSEVSETLSWRDVAIAELCGQSQNLDIEALPIPLKARLRAALLGRMRSAETFDELDALLDVHLLTS